jgi:hypothetical protein
MRSSKKSETSRINRFSISSRLLQDLPISAEERSYIEPSEFSQFMGNLGLFGEGYGAILNLPCPSGKKRNVFGFCVP